MTIADRYRDITDLPATLPVFPLAGALLLPRAVLPLNIFEPRYLTMVDDALARHRLIGMIQPGTDATQAGAGSAPPASDTDKPPLYQTGCAGRLTSYTETDDGRVLITLTGVCRFHVTAELEATTPYRQCAVSYEPFADDLKPGHGADDVDRVRLLEILKAYLETNNLQADWTAIENSSNEALVNSLSMISPYGPAEKQALLEAKTLEERNQMLIALTEIALANQTDTEPTVQ